MGADEGRAGGEDKEGDVGEAGGIPGEVAVRGMERLVGSAISRKAPSNYCLYVEICEKYSGILLKCKKIFYNTIDDFSVCVYNKSESKTDNKDCSAQGFLDCLC